MSNRNRTEKLRKLLENSFGSSENPWISRLDVENAVLDVGEKGELRHWARYGSMKRDWENDERGKPIDGFECLLRNLDTTGAQTVLIHKVFDESGRLYRIFTDPEIIELIGVLRFPITNAAEPYSVRIKKLKKLIADSYGSSENPWVSKPEAEKAVFDVAEGDGILLNSVRDIYTRRGRRNKKLGNPIDGFECLLKNLDTTQARTVIIHRVADEHLRKYWVFTDPEINELLGLLRFPVDRSTKRPLTM